MDTVSRGCPWDQSGDTSFSREPCLSPPQTCTFLLSPERCGLCTPKASHEVVQM